MRTVTLARPLRHDFVARICCLAGARIIRAVSLWADRHRLLRELEALPECDLRRMRMSQADLGHIARDEARRRSDTR
jgi:hypothetical protein